MAPRADASHAGSRPALRGWNRLHRDGHLQFHARLWPKHSTQLQLLSNGFPARTAYSGHNRPRTNWAARPYFNSGTSIQLNLTNRAKGTRSE